MLPGERRNRILELLQVSRTITVQALCDALAASEATIRRDLTILESEGRLERTHGGAILSFQTRPNIEESFQEKESRYGAQKRAIALKAFGYLKENDSIVLDAGTTTFELARLIGQSTLHITVITNSTILAGELAGNPNLELIALGGKVRLHTQATVGSIAIETLQRFNINKAFIAVNGISADRGPTTPDLEEAAIKNAMLTAGFERFVLADHTKFNRIFLCQIAPISMIDTIITDADLDPALVPAFEQQDVQVVIA